jgi:polar amino acid transport system substrate-binding protein
MKQRNKNMLVKFITLMTLIGNVFPLSGQTLQIETINVAPFGFIGDNSKPTGMMFEISNRIAEVAGLNYTNKIIPYARTIIHLKQGKSDFVLRFNNDQLPAISIPLVSVITMPIIILSRAGTHYRSLKDLHGKTVGVVRGGEFDVNFDNDTAINKVEVNNYTQMLKLLISGRIDGCIGTNVGLYYNAKRLGIKPEVLNSPLQLSFKDFVLHFSKKKINTQTMKILKKSVEKLKSNGEIQTIVNKYIGDFK